MAFHIRDPEADRLLREAARRRNVGLTEAVKLGARAILEQDRSEADARVARIRALQDEVSRIPRTGLEADKAFYDSLNDEED